MQTITNLLGFEATYVTMILALGIVLVLIVLAVWLIKMLGEATRSVGRGRNKRLSIIDSVSIDQKRQAIIIRRDEVEYLIVTGGPNDLVVDAGFPAPPPLPARAPRRGQPLSGTQPIASAVPAGTEEDEDKANIARLRSAKPRKGSSLRHTALLRSVKDDTDELVGGKSDNRPNDGNDSVKNESGPSKSGDLQEAGPDAVENEYADEGKSR